MTALSDRVEAASGDEQRATLKEAYHAIFPHNSPQHDHQHRARFIGFLDAEAYLEAAMMLVPEVAEWTLSIAAYEPCLATIPSGYDRVDAVHGYAATPAHALTAACLRARGL